ncbi:MAG: acetate--CoA ligase family protein, partial [bacterium]
GLGISRFVGSGNEAVVTCDQVLEYFGADPLTKVIIMYIEGIDYGSRFLDVARRVTPHKAVIALKMGVTAAGADAAASHSGAVSTPHRVYEAMVKQAGIIEASSTEEMVNLARTFGYLPIPKSRKVGIMTMGGGWGVVTTDHSARAGLELPLPSATTIEEIDQVLPEFWSHGNPVDLVGMLQRSAHYAVLEAMVRDPNFDSIITLGSLTGVQYVRDRFNWRRILKMQLRALKRHRWRVYRFYLAFFKSVWKAFRGSRKKKDRQQKGQSGGINLREARRWSDDVFAEEIRRLMQSSGKPIVPVPFEPASVPAIFKNLGLVAFRVPEEAVLAIAKLAHYHDFLERHRKEQEQIEYEAPDDDMALAIRSGLEGRSGALSESESKTILTRYGIDVTDEKTASSKDEAVAAAEAIGYPVVLKVDSPDITHKSDAGGVAVGLESADEVSEAFDRVMESCRAYDGSARISGVVVQEMVEGGTEVLVGVSRESHYGHTIVFGLGGVFVEVLDDVSLRILPIERLDAKKMIDEIRGRKVLSGIRGEEPRDVPALAEAIKRTADLAWDLRDRLEDMDINPLVVLPEGQGVKALDALIILNEGK